MISHVIPFEKMEFRMFRKLANYLDISFSELIDIAPTLMPIYIYRDFVCGYVLSFKPEAPARILKKIEMLSLHQTVYMHFYNVNEELSILQMKN